MLWLIMGLMCLLAIVFVTRSLLAKQERNVPVAIGLIVFVVVSSLTLYAYLGSPNLPSGAGQEPDITAMVASLAARLEQQPDDVNGWKMLGRSYMTLGNFDAAVGALEKAVELESAQNAQTLVDFGVAVAQAEEQQLSARAVTAFENALALDPNHPEALFYGGIAAYNRKDPVLAAKRWERLLDTNPPPEVRAILEQRIAAWRGYPSPEPSPAAQPASDATVTVAISLSEDARKALPAEATVFVIARDPAQPSPPIAVTRRTLSELPATVSLGDRESMIPGRVLSGFSQFELVARVSVSGSPAEQPGDWYGAVVVTPAEASDVSITIDKPVR